MRVEPARKARPALCAKIRRFGGVGLGARRLLSVSSSAVSRSLGGRVSASAFAGGGRGGAGEEQEGADAAGLGELIALS